MIVLVGVQFGSLGGQPLCHERMPAWPWAHRRPQGVLREAEKLVISKALQAHQAMWAECGPTDAKLPSKGLTKINGLGTNKTQPQGKFSTQSVNLGTSAYYPIRIQSSDHHQLTLRTVKMLNNWWAWLAQATSHHLPYQSSPFIRRLLAPLKLEA